jgi:hypothetical protein
MGRALLRLPNVKRLFSFWSSKIVLHKQAVVQLWAHQSRTTFHCSKTHCVCMARHSFTYTYGSWGICKGKLSKRKSNSEVSLQKHRATRQVSRDPTNPETDHGSTQLLVSLQRQPERVCVRPHFINAWEETPPFQRVQQWNNGSSQVTLTSSCTVQSFHQILLHEVTRLFGLRLKARCTLLSFLNVLYECAPLPHPPPIHNKNCKVFVRVKDL